MIHPIVACAADIRASLKGVASVNPTFMSTDDKAIALGELVRAEAQLVELRLRVLADAGDLAVATAAKDAAGWLARRRGPGSPTPGPTWCWRRRWTGSTRCWRRRCVTVTSRWRRRR